MLPPVNATADHIARGFQVRSIKCQRADLLGGRGTQAFRPLVPVVQWLYGHLIGQWAIDALEKDRLSRVFASQMKLLVGLYQFQPLKIVMF